MATEATKRVVLLHGLAETRLRMGGLALLFAQAGYHVVNHGYPSTAYPIEQLTDRFLLPLMDELRASGETTHFVTHSLGGILLRDYARRHPLPDIGRVVMIAPPNHGSPIFNYYRRHPLLAALYGPAAQQSGTDEDSFMLRLPKLAPFELGIIANTVPLDPLAMLVTPWPHDGRTDIEGTKLAGMKDHIVIPASHELSPLNPMVGYQALRFIADGSFHHAEPGAAFYAARPSLAA